MFEISNVCSAFKTKTVGTKVLRKEALLHCLAVVMAGPKTLFNDEGHAKIDLTHILSINPPIVSGGDAIHTHLSSDYIIRIHRGQVNMFLRRELALPITSLKVIVYTRAAYQSDPDITTEERIRINNTDCQYVIVAVLASAAPEAPVSPWRFLCNLAGGNTDYKAYDKDTLVTMAKETQEYHSKYCTVAD